MSLEVTYTVQVGTIATKVDLTSSTAGFSVRQPLQIMAPSTHTAVITLYNYDGQFTPSEGGGTGTYADLDWFDSAIFIDAEVNGGNDAVIFHGLITDFKLVDDGVVSFVEITAIDAVSFLGRAVIDPVSILGWLSSVISATTRLQNQIPGGAILPALGETGSDIRDWIVTGPPFYEEHEVDGTAVTDDQTISDALATQVMPSGMSLLWATRIGEYFTDYATYEEIIVGQALNRQEETGASAYATVRHYTLVDTSPGTDEFNFVDLEVGYNTDKLRNYATIRSASTGNTTSVGNSASIAKYGVQTFTASSVLLANDDDVEQHGYNVTNRMGTVRFAPTRATLTTSALADHPSASAAQLGHLLDNGGGLWQTVSVTYTPTGASTPITNLCMIAGRTINATPGNTTITLDLLPAADYQSFVLDSSTLGVLDTNRLG